MSDEQASSPSSAFCAESVATLHTVRKTPAARINLRAFPAAPQGQTGLNGESDGDEVIELNIRMAAIGT